MIVHHSSSVTLKNKKQEFILDCLLSTQGQNINAGLIYTYTYLHFLIIGAEGSTVS